MIYELGCPPAQKTVTTVNNYGMFLGSGIPT